MRINFKLNRFFQTCTPIKQIAFKNSNVKKNFFDNRNTACLLGALMLLKMMVIIEKYYQIRGSKEYLERGYLNKYKNNFLRHVSTLEQFSNKKNIFTNCFCSLVISGKLQLLLTFFKD